MYVCNDEAITTQASYIQCARTTVSVLQIKLHIYNMHVQLYLFVCSYYRKTYQYTQFSLITSLAEVWCLVWTNPAATVKVTWSGVWVDFTHIVSNFQYRYRSRSKIWYSNTARRTCTCNSVLSVSSRTSTTDAFTLVRIPDLVRWARNEGLASTLAFSWVEDVVSGADGIGSLWRKWKE